MARLKTKNYTPHQDTYSSSARDLVEFSRRYGRLTASQKDSLDDLMSEDFSEVEHDHVQMLTDTFGGFSEELDGCIADYVKYVADELESVQNGGRASQICDYDDGDPMRFLG